MTIRAALAQIIAGAPRSKHSDVRRGSCQLSLARHPPIPISLPCHFTGSWRTQDTRPCQTCLAHISISSSLSDSVPLVSLFSPASISCNPLPQKASAISLQEVTFCLLYLHCHSSCLTRYQSGVYSYTVSLPRVSHSYQNGLSRQVRHRHRRRWPCRPSTFHLSGTMGLQDQARRHAPRTYPHWPRRRYPASITRPSAQHGSQARDHGQRPGKGLRGRLLGSCEQRN